MVGWQRIPKHHAHHNTRLQRSVDLGQRHRRLADNALHSAKPKPAVLKMQIALWLGDQAARVSDRHGANNAGCSQFCD